MPDPASPLHGDCSDPGHSLTTPLTLAPHPVRPIHPQPVRNYSPLTMLPREGRAIWAWHLFTPTRSTRRSPLRRARGTPHCARSCYAPFTSQRCIDLVLPLGPPRPITEIASGRMYANILDCGCTDPTADAPTANVHIVPTPTQESTSVQCSRGVDNVHDDDQAVPIARYNPYTMPSCAHAACGTSIRPRCDRPEGNAHPNQPLWKHPG
jgi:hypothetical protein